MPLSKALIRLTSAGFSVGSCSRCFSAPTTSLCWRMTCHKVLFLVLWVLTGGQHANTACQVLAG